MNNRLFIYWPDGSWREAPTDGHVYFSLDGGNHDTYQWDAQLEAWVSGYGGKIVDFTPPGMPNKVYEMDDKELEALYGGPLLSTKKPHSCECGAIATSNPNCHSSWCPAGGVA